MELFLSRFLWTLDGDSAKKGGDSSDAVDQQAAACKVSIENHLEGVQGNSFASGHTDLDQF